MGRFGKGHIPDPMGHMRTGFHVLAMALALSNTTPDGVNLSAHAPKNFDQGPTSACVGHARSGAIACSLSVAGHPLPWVPSPNDAYKMARCVDRVPNLDGSLEPLTDEGAMPNQAMRAMELWGTSPIGPMASDGRYSDCDPATINDEPTVRELERDSATKLIGEYGITSTGAQRVLDIRKALAAGFAICFAVQVDDAFEAWTGGTPITAPKGSLGGHYLYAIGYRTDANGKTILLFRNSWGTLEWGINGDGQGDEAFIAAISDIVVMAVHKEAA